MTSHSHFEKVSIQMFAIIVNFIDFLCLLNIFLQNYVLWESWKPAFTQTIHSPNLSSQLVTYFVQEISCLKYSNVALKHFSGLLPH